MKIEEASKKVLHRIGAHSLAKKLAILGLAFVYYAGMGANAFYAGYKKANKFCRDNPLLVLLIEMFVAFLLFILDRVKKRRSYVTWFPRKSAVHVSLY